MGAPILTLEEQESAATAVVLRHPIRVYILEVLNETDMSPSQFLKARVAPRHLMPSLSHVAYHFRKLAESGCLEIVTDPEMGAARASRYRGTAREFFTEEEWAKLSERERRSMSKALLQGLLARANGAAMAGTFDARLDRHLSCVSLELDERGWGELTKSLAAALRETERIRKAAIERLRGSDEKSFPATVGVLAFESRPRGRRP